MSQPTPGKRQSKQMGLIYALKPQPLQAPAHGDMKHEIQTQGLASKNALCSKLGVIYRSFLAALIWKLSIIICLNISGLFTYSSHYMKHRFISGIVACSCVRLVSINMTSQSLTKDSCSRTCQKTQSVLESFFASY